jgi:hypothetical protein
VLKRRFRIYYDAPTCSWRWECTMCWPPARGARFGKDAWEKIIRLSLKHHMDARWNHHKHVASRG